jgi:hypothetical protein
MNKLAIFAVLLCLVVVPTFAYRIRFWNENSKCRGGPSGEIIYSNKKGLCQPSQTNNNWIKALTDCKNGKSVSFQEYTDGTCSTSIGDLTDSYVVNNGDCISYNVGSQYSYKVDCSNASIVAPGFLMLLALIASLLL